MQRLAIISDTHLSPRHGFFYGNVARTIETINDASPDLIVHAGDISVNGADDEDDLRFAAFVHRQAGAPIRFVAGNHDVGEEPGAEHVGQPIAQARLERFHSVFGASWWVEHFGPWRLIAINPMLFGTGLDAEGEQWAWLLGALAAVGDAPVGLITHKPLWLEGPDDAVTPDTTVAPVMRARLRAALAGVRLGFVVSGHLHQHRVRQSDGALHVWAPSCAFPADRSVGGVAELGFAMLSLGDDGSAHAEIVRPDRLVAHDYKALKGNGAYAFLKDCPPAPPDIDWPR